MTWGQYAYAGAMVLTLVGPLGILWMSEHYGGPWSFLFAVACVLVALRLAALSGKWRQRIRLGFYIALFVAILMVLTTWAGKRGYFWGDPVPLSEALRTFPSGFVVGFVASVWWDYFNRRGRS